MNGSVHERVPASPSGCPPPIEVPGELRWRLSDFYAEYAACLDAGEYEYWPAFFADDCRYRVVPRENHDRGLPLSTIDLHGLGMLRDRVYAVTSTLFHGPYYQRHLIGPLRITAFDGSSVAIEANYLVVRTKRDAMSELFNTGRYLDTLSSEGGALKFVEKICVFDSELIPNSLIYPI